MRRKPVVDQRTALLFPCPEANTPAEPEGRRILQPVWTAYKARLIERYLYHFVLVTRHGCYIDGFAGPQNDEPESWAAELVLYSRPAWMRQFHLCELKDSSFAHLEGLRNAYIREHPHLRPRRTIDLYHGDFNEKLPAILANLPKPRATFCLLDQRTFECRWATVETLARHHSSGNKIELFYFLATGWLGRSLYAQQDETKLQAWWGRPDWSNLQGLSAYELARVVTERFRSELGYASAKPWPIYASATSDRIMYFMVHATDHPEAPKLMYRAYRKAVGPRETFREIKQLELALLDLPPDV